MSALTKDRQNRIQINQARRGGGALAAGPREKFKVGNDLTTLQNQQQRLQARIDRRGGAAPRAENRLNQVNERLGQLQGQPDVIPGQTPQQAQNQESFDQTTGQANQYLGQVFGQLQNQGQFNPQNMPELPQFNQQALPQMPQDYSKLRQQASDSVMQDFERNMGPQFQRQEEQLRQQLIETGNQPGSPQFERQLRDLRDQQGSSRQNAMTQAFQAGQGEAQVGYGQAMQNRQQGMAEQGQQFGQGLAGRGQMFNEQYQSYQLPMAQLNAISPYYGYQNQAGMQNQQFGWQGGQNAMDRQQQFDAMAKDNQYRLQQIAATPRGGGGGNGALSYDQQLGLLDRSFYNQMVMQGLQNGQSVPRPGYGGGAAQGLATGIGMGLGSALK